jgi:hypothetical protein
VKVLSQVAYCATSTEIVASGEMLMEHLLTGSSVLSLERILKLREGVNPGEVAFFCPVIKLGDRLIECKFDTVLAVIVVDFNKKIVLGIIALQLVDFGQGVIVVPRFLNLIERQRFVDWCHGFALVALCISSSYCACFSRSL